MGATGVMVAQPFDDGVEWGEIGINEKDETDTGLHQGHEREGGQPLC